METKERREGRRRGAGEEQDDDKGEAMKTKALRFSPEEEEEDTTTTTTGETASGERTNICSKNESHRGEKCRHHHRRGPFLGGMPAFGADVFVVRANI